MFRRTDSGGVRCTASLLPVNRLFRVVLIEHWVRSYRSRARVVAHSPPPSPLNFWVIMSLTGTTSITFSRGGELVFTLLGVMTPVDINSHTRNASVRCARPIRRSQRLCAGLYRERQSHLPGHGTDGSRNCLFAHCQSSNSCSWWYASHTPSSRKNPPLMTKCSRYCVLSGLIRRCSALQSLLPESSLYLLVSYRLRIVSDSTSKYIWNPCST